MLRHCFPAGELPENGGYFPAGEARNARRGYTPASNVPNTRRICSPLSGLATYSLAWEMLAYMICGFLVGIAALFFVATYTTVQPGYGDQYNNEAIAGCVMGGTSMVGGLASIGGTVIGVFIISLLQQGIMAFGLGKGQQMIITGIIVIVAVYADVSARRRKN